MPDESLDPRRNARNERRRDFASMSRTFAVGRIPTLLARVLVRAGLIR